MGEPVSSAVDQRRAGAGRVKPTIYLVTNRTTGDTYVGVTRGTLSARWRQHVYVANRGAVTRLHKAVVEHGPEAFRVEPIASCLRPEWAAAFEQEVIKALRPTYNQTNGGQFTVGKRVAPEVVERIRVANTGQRRTPEQRAANSAAKKRQYAERPELRALMAHNLAKARAVVNEERRRAASSASSKNRVWSDESRAKLSASCMGRRYLHVIKPVECITLGQVFESAAAAAKATGLSVSSIRHAVLGHQRRAGGLEFRYP